MLALIGCDTTVAAIFDGGTRTDSKCPTPPDLSSTAANCAAAKGISGDILGGVCIDMNSTNTTALTNLGFDLTSATMNCAGWEVASSQLQPNNLNTSPGFVTCGMSLPSIPINTTQYPRVTLALIHQANLPNTGQVAKIELPNAVPLELWANPGITVDQRTSIEFDTTSIPGGPNLQAAIQLLAPQGSPTPSWTISSIAVLGQTQ
jgi:hypothetical protein